MVMQRDEQGRVNPDDCIAAMQQCEERRPDFSYSRVRILTAAVSGGNAVTPVNSQASGFSYGLQGSMQAAFGGDPTAVAAALAAAGNANGSDTDLVTQRESDGDLFIESFSLVPIGLTDARLAIRLMAESFLNIQFDGKTVKRVPAILAPAGAGLTGAGESFTAASAAAQTVAAGLTNGVPRPQARFSWGSAPILWRGGGPYSGGAYDKLTVNLEVPRSVSVPSGGTAALTFDALIVAVGVRAKGVAFQRT